ncbi:hypothetical protein [Chryseobacterium sp. C3]|uniref:hypothetical protein n=1 Tax=Chryseobacterium sp. C3 TaxID=2761532 RepID=UPI001626C6F5|nr:hypothetical protein [Chryseobacterium sp. C3]
MKIYLFLLLSFFSCSRNNTKVQSQNFYFEYWKGEDHYSSKDSLFTRNYEANDQMKRSDSTRKVVLTEEEIKKIVNEINNYSILDLPNDFSCNILPINDPHFIHVKIVNNNKIKDIIFTYSHSNPKQNCSKGKRIVNFRKVLDSIIYRKKNVKELPATNLYYE